MCSVIFVEVEGSLAIPATERERDNRSLEPGSARKEMGCPSRNRSPLLLRVSSGRAVVVSGLGSGVLSLVGSLSNDSLVAVVEGGWVASSFVLLLLASSVWGWHACRKAASLSL